jgi:archaellum component FlaF (FlaF/FlaG flagellin family)
MLYLAMALTVLICFKTYLSYIAEWLPVDDASIFRKGEVVKMEYNKFKVVDVNYYHNEIKIRVTILGF